MSALHKSLDETLAAIREAHNLEMQQCKDKMLAAEVKAALLENQLATAVEMRARSERLAVKLYTQFAVVEQVLSDARILAADAYATPEPTPTHGDEPATPTADKLEGATL